MQGPDGDEITFAGQRGVFNNISLDGGDYNNGFFGEQVGGQRAAIDITLDAVKEFQVVATGANAEFGRTAGGVVNVITKSGTNQTHGSLFHYQRLEGLTSNTSDGKPLTDFHREQFGGTVGGPIVKDKVVLLRRARGHPREPAAAEPVGADRHAVPGGDADARRQRSADQRQRRLPARSRSSTSSRRAADRTKGSRSTHTINNNALLGKIDWALERTATTCRSPTTSTTRRTRTRRSTSPTYGTSANGTEGPSKINLLNVNLFSTLTRDAG